ncbi:TPA: hypothetical protein ACOEME_004705, partial [Enterobacter cloacae subsp. dissolvens]
VLTVISLVALVTVESAQIPADAGWLAWYSWLLYLPATWYVLAGLMLLVNGSGPAGTDRVILRAHRELSGIRAD